MPVIVLTSATTWKVPNDWNNLNSTIYAFGGGAGANKYSTDPSPGGGGGACAIVTKLQLTPGSIVYYNIGAGGTGATATAGGTGGAGGDTWLNKISAQAPTVISQGLLAKGGLAPATMFVGVLEAVV